jgi:hypothetical protein
MAEPFVRGRLAQQALVDQLELGLLGGPALGETRS